MPEYPPRAHSDPEWWKRSPELHPKTDLICWWDLCGECGHVRLLHPEGEPHCTAGSGCSCQNHPKLRIGWRRAVIVLKAGHTRQSGEH